MENEISNHLLSKQNTESEFYMIRSLGAANTAVNVTPVKFDDNSSDELIKTLSKDNSLQNLLVKAIVYLKNNIDSAHEVIEYLIGENEFLIDGLAEHELSYENKQILRQVLMANKNILILDYKSSLIELKNLSRKLWEFSIVENINPVDDNKAIEFKDYIVFPKINVDKSYCIKHEIREEKYCDAYPYATVGAYKSAKKYPSGKDIRPAEFDFSESFGQGTNLNAVILAAANCNLQLAPGIKQNKLQGDILNYVENRAIRPYSSKYIPLFRLTCQTSRYSYLKKNAESSTNKLNDNSSKNTFASLIPVLVIGDRVGNKLVVRSGGGKNELGYKRLNIRILAFNNKQDMVDAARILATIKHPDIMQLKLCTYDDLKRAEQKKDPYPYPFPNVPKLWNQSSTLEELCAREVDSVAKDLSLIS